MGRFRKWTRLELAAAIVLVATIASIVIVVFGVFRDDPERSAERVTAVCRPLGTAMASNDPARIDNRDVARLRNATERAATELGEVIKDADAGLRGRSAGVRERLDFAADEFDLMPLRQRIEVIEQAGRGAAVMGATCKAPITAAQGAEVDERLAKR